MPRVTALRELPRGRVRVDLDGVEWRTLPATAVVAAGVVTGGELDRARARALRRALRRSEALRVAERALRHRDHSRAGLDERLEAAAIPPAARAAAIAALEEVGVVDDTRAAAARAEALSGRGYGDAAIRFDLDRRGFSAPTVAAALDTLMPEVDRARDVVDRRGVSPATARRLASRGFDRDTIEAVVAADGDGALG